VTRANAPVGDVLTPADVAAVEARIRPYLRCTPVASLDRADFGLSPGPLTLKLEQLQFSGSFKARGAFANMLLRDVPDAGVAAASGGNHGAAVAYAAGVLGVPARIFVPEVSSAAKISRIRGYGADLVVEGATYSDALAISERWITASGAMPVPAFDPGGDGARRRDAGPGADAAGPGRHDRAGRGGRRRLAVRDRHRLR
jgi:threonine dehydratase